MSSGLAGKRPAFFKGRHPENKKQLTELEEILKTHISVKGLDLEYIIRLTLLSNQKTTTRNWARGLIYVSSQTINIQGTKWWPAK